MKIETYLDTIRWAKTHKFELISGQKKYIKYNENYTCLIAGQNITSFFIFEMCVDKVSNQIYHKWFRSFGIEWCHMHHLGLNSKCLLYCNVPWGCTNYGFKQRHALVRIFDYFKIAHISCNRCSRKRQFEVFETKDLPMLWHYVKCKFRQNVLQNVWPSVFYVVLVVPINLNMNIK